MVNAKGLPDSLINMLSAADKKQGFPEGTMFSVMQQESGGQERFLKDPTTYHYEANKDGKRIAKHTGKVSTAFGLFGILDSTGAKPGYGVSPLKDKGLEEQVRFASDYLAARSKQAGGLSGGLAGYGEGAKYSQQVQARTGARDPAKSPLQPVANPVPAPVELATVQAAPELSPVQVVAGVPTEMPPQEMALAPTNYGATNPWVEFNQAMQQKQLIKAEELAAYEASPRPVDAMTLNVPDFMQTVGGGPVVGNRVPAFQAFGSWGTQKGRA